jgi:DNA-binding CsgD family transcriptional regulator
MEQAIRSSSPLFAAADLPAETVHSLTRREKEILTLIADGQSNRQMAEFLVVSPETVKTHVRHVLGKLGVARKAEIRALIQNRRYQ